MILLNACGLESLALLWQFKEEKALYINEGFPFSRIQELHWRWLCEEYNIPLIVGTGCSAANKSLLLSDRKIVLGYSQRAVEKYLGMPVTAGMESEGRSLEVSEEKDLWYIPARYGVLLALAVQAAECQKSVLRLATCRRPSPAPDASPEAVEAILEPLLAGCFNPPEVQMPFRDVEYTQVISDGEKRGSPYKKVWTCINDLDRFCAVCAPCLERQKTFKQITGRCDGDGSAYYKWPGHSSV